VCRATIVLKRDVKKRRLEEESGEGMFSADEPAARCLAKHQGYTGERARE